jgi:hypothetical protein
VVVRFARVKHHEQQVGGFAHGDDLAAAAAPLRRSLDDAGQIQQLDLGVVVVDDALDRGRGGRARK